MDPRANFVSIVDDLIRCADGEKQYDLLRIPGLLRPLLLDGLIDQVNREFRQKIRFQIGGTLEGSPTMAMRPESLQFTSVMDGFDPDIFDAPGTPASLVERREVSRDELLKAPLIWVKGHTFTLHDLIESLGYVFGLIHSGEPKTPKDAALLAWRRNVRTGGAPVGLREIRAVARVVHRGLLPLREALLAKYGDSPN